MAAKKESKKIVKDKEPKKAVKEVNVQPVINIGLVGHVDHG